MKTFALLLMVISATSIAFAQQEKKVESTITNATVFLTKGQVYRKVETKVESGKTDLVLSGLSSSIEPQSIQVTGKGNFVLLGQTLRHNYLDDENMPRGLKVLKDSLDYYQRQLTLENSQREILTKEEQMVLSNQKIGGANQNLTAAELKAMADFFRSRLTELVSAKMKVDIRIAKYNERIQKIRRQVDEQTNYLSTNTAEIVVSVSSSASTSVELVVSYVVPGAGWTPVYDLRAINTKSPIKLNYKATVYQTTGEDWKNVRLKLSTANPNLTGQKPELAIWYLNFYDYRPKNLGFGAVHRSAPAMEKAMDDFPSASQESEVLADYVTPIETTLNTEFDINLPYNIHSSNNGVMVDIRSDELKADYIHAVSPKLDNDVFLIARSTGWEDLSLLPGEASIFFEGTFVGKSTIDPNSITDTLSLSLGRDNRITVKREKLKDFSSRSFIGTNKREKFAYEISIRNTKTEPATIMVEDQVPVSQNNQIEVSVEDVGGAKWNKDTGKLTWEITLAAGETKKLRYAFEVKYPKDRRILTLD